MEASHVSHTIQGRYQSEAVVGSKSPVGAAVLLTPAELFLEDLFDLQGRYRVLTAFGTD